MKQRVSELMDSELDESAAAHVIAAIEADASLKQDWNDYHLIGDALRANSRADVDVRAAVTAQLANEPVVLAPRRWTGRARVRTAGAVALAASVSFAAVIGWQQLYAPQRPAMLLASADTAQTSQLQLASNNADAYFLAHQEMAADQGLVKVAYRQEAANQ